MPLDSLLISGLAAELNAALSGARIDKIHQPARDRIVLAVRTEGGAKRLLLSAGSDARVHFTQSRFENPDTPPGFCVRLRRLIGGGRITAVRQPGRERIVELDISSSDELGDLSQKTLVCEMTGRMTNLILRDETGVITACLKTVPPGGEHRPVMPGLKYRLPPAQAKPSVYGLSGQALLEMCANAPPGGLLEHIRAHTGGIAPLLAAQIAADAGQDHAAAARALHALKSAVPRPFMVLDGGKAVDFAAFEVRGPGGRTSREYPDFSGLLDDFYRERTESTAIKNAASSLTKTMTAVKNRLTRRIAGQRQEYLTAQGREAFKNRADLITANLHAIAPGAASVTVTDFFSEGMEAVKIELDPQLSPQQNARKLYKRYARLKNAEQALALQIERGERELEYVENVLYTLSAARSLAEIEQIRLEMLEGGYIRDKKRPKPAVFAPRQFELGEGVYALCGRNNAENDRLLKGASKSDLWLHARNMPGAHVHLRAHGREPDERAIERAAALAAYFSSGGASPRVAVDYCLVKYVKKIAGAGPGMVTYSNFKTAIVAPEKPGAGEELV